MKEYFSKRNERLLKKLFERQKITVREIGIPQMTAWQAHEPNEGKRRRIEEDFKSILQERWIGAGNQPLSKEALEKGLQSIISEAPVDGNALAKDIKLTAAGKADPEKEAELEEFIKNELAGMSQTDERIKALGDFYAALSDQEKAQAAVMASKAETPEEGEKVLDKIEAAAEDGDEEEKEFDPEGHVPLTRSDGNLAAALADAGASDDIAKRILKAVADQLKVNNIQFVESKLKRTIKETLSTMNEGKEDVRGFITRYEKGDKSAIDDIRKEYARITVKGDGKQTGNMIRAWAEKNNIDLTATSVKMPATADSSKLIAFMEKNPALQQLMSKVDSNMDVVGFVGAVIELMIEKNPEIDVSKALMKIAPLAKAIEREKEKAKEDALQGGFDTKSGDLKLATRKGVINFTGIRKLMHNHLFKDPEKARAITRQINNWLQNNIAKEDGIELVENDKKFFSSLLETLKALKTETHAIATPDEDDGDELDAGEELDALELDDTEEFEIEDEELEEEKNPYAICTASVGRKDEKKYKSCKDKVAAQNKK